VRDHVPGVLAATNDEFRRRAALRGSRGAALDPRLHVVSPHYFAKARADALSSPALDAHLRARQVGRMVLAGVFADQCVYATARGALNRGYAVTLLADAIGAASESARRSAARGLARRGVLVTTATGFIAHARATITAPTVAWPGDLWPPTAPARRRPLSGSMIPRPNRARRTYRALAPRARWA
jgi:nicotinamidase-related amidase